MAHMWIASGARRALDRGSKSSVDISSIFANSDGNKITNHKFKFELFIGEIFGRHKNPEY